MTDSKTFRIRSQYRSASEAEAGEQDKPQGDFVNGAIFGFGATIGMMLAFGAAAILYWLGSML